MTPELTPQAFAGDLSSAEIAAALAARMNVSEATARRYLRASIELPDGRVIFGQQPGMSAVTLPEHRLRDVLARQLRGITEACLPYGRADVLTKTHAFEVEPMANWRGAVRQALTYSAQTGLPPAVALFGPIRRDDMIKRYRKLRDSRPPVALWWWGGSSWVQISSVAACRTVRGEDGGG